MTAHPPKPEAGCLVSTDARIENEVRAALRRDPRIRVPELIAASVDEIGTVVLSGAVESFPQRMAALHDARRVDGVFEVIIDDLKVHPPLGDRRPDDEIRVAALQHLIDDSRIRSNHIHVKVSHGTITLSGYVRKESERRAAVEDVTRLTGVREVRDQIKVK
jgi:osmotically-inducible protein OsmY